MFAEVPEHGRAVTSQMFYELDGTPLGLTEQLTSRRLRSISGRSRSRRRYARSGRRQHRPMASAATGLWSEDRQRAAGAIREKVPSR
jgi:hypothetical protein